MRLLVVALFLLPLPAWAQPAAKHPRLCLMSFAPNAEQVRQRFQPFFRGMRDLGYVEGGNVIFDIKTTTDSTGEQFSVLAKQCVDSRADVIVAFTTPAAQAAKQATRTIPIVMNPLGDPVGTGLVASLAHPGGNVTGLTFMAASMSAKRLSLLKEAFPRISRVLVFSYLKDPIAPPQVAAMQEVATALGIKLLVHEIRTGEDYAAGFEAGRREKVEAVITTSESITFVNRVRVIQLAAKHRLPSMLWNLQFVEEGALMSYAPDYNSFYPRTAAYVDRILKGAKPADLPIEQPSNFVFAVNLKTAKSLGVTIPQTLLVRVNRIIE